MLARRLLLAGVLLGNVARASVIDSFLSGKPFECETSQTVFEGSFRKVSSPETFWADCIIGGIEPNRYPYFLVREPVDRSKIRFDLVFFDALGRGVAVGVAQNFVRSLTDHEISFEFTLKGGGEAGTIETVRRISLEFDAADKRLSGTIAERSRSSTIWTSDRIEAGKAKLEFLSVSLPEETIALAMGCRTQPGKEASQSKDPSQ